MRGHCILCHGFESGPDATKVTALAAVQVPLLADDVHDLAGLRRLGSQLFA